jgi:4Fe-4S ferredoxin
MLCAIVCPTDAFHENIVPEGHINLEEFPTIDKFFKIDLKKCIEDPKNEICRLCLKVRDRNSIKEYYKISKECPTQCFHINSPIEGEVILRKNMLWKCDPQGCKACVNICPVESFFIPETAEDVIKYGKIACNEDACFYCGACENSCPDDLIVVNRKDILIKDPQKQGDFPWIKGWVQNIKDILRKRLVENVKEPVDIPIIQQEIEKVKERILEEIPQLSDEEREKLNALNEKVQSLLKTRKIRYWIKDGKSDKVVLELKKKLKKES